MIPADRRVVAQVLRNLGHTYQTIGERLDVSTTTVWRWTHPAEEARHRAQARRWKVDNRDRKRASDAEYHQRTKIPCPNCGHRVSRHRWPPTTCPGCAWIKRRRIRELWLAGRSIREIAADLGTTRGTIAQETVRLRRNGVDLPYRHPAYRRHAVA